MLLHHLLENKRKYPTYQPSRAKQHLHKKRDHYLICEHKKSIHQITMKNQVNLGVQKKKSPETKLNTLEDCDSNDRNQGCSYKEPQQYTRKLRNAVQ